ncbi:hypothetical protein LCGC14_0711670 [marine sediment metagenome]|uniref:T9SS type B sorting domain-containing protein n=1 Tax=marine sediment metagenome TaxID=412755 RepID=A0A0F9R0A1_9ZZZZ
MLFGVSYTVEVRDTTTGCTYEEVITLPDSPGIDVDILVDGLTCRNGNVGVNYNITSGTAPFDVIITNLNDGTVVYNVTGSSLLTLAADLSVPAGRYGVSVVDSAAPSCSGGDEGEAILNLPRVDIIENQNANCNALGQITVRANGGTAPYEYAFIEQGTLPLGNIPPLSDFDSSPTQALAGSLTGVIYDIWVLDGAGCPATTSAAMIQLNPDLPEPTIMVNNQCDVTPPPTGWDITIEMPGDIDTPTFTLNGITQTPVYTPGVPTQATFNVGSIGRYPVHIIDANGCDIDTVAEVFQVLSASGDFIGIGPNCENPDGTIRITANGGSGNFNYVLSGVDFLGNPISRSILDDGDDSIHNFTVDFTNLPPGDYEVEVEDQVVTGGSPVGPCTFIVDGIFRSQPIQPDIDDTGATNISCNGLNDGSIGVSLIVDPVPDNNPTIKEYNLYNSDLASMPSNYDVTSRIDNNVSGAFENLGPGIYVVEVVTDRNCYDREEVTIIDPPVFGIEVSADPLVCNPNANQYSTTFIRTTIANSGADIGNGGPYGYKIDATDSYQASPDFLIVDNGTDQTITVYAIDDNGCESNATITILAPNDVTATITQVRAMDCELPERIRITVTNSSNFIIQDQGSSVSPVTDVSGTSVVEFDLPQVAGEYRLQINDVAGCTYPLEPYIVTEPVLPTATIRQNEPVGCLGATDGILEIEITNLASLVGFSGIYDYIVYDAADPGFSGGAFGTPVAGNSSGTIDISSAGNPATITGLPTGNLRVVIHESNKTVTACNIFSNASFIDTPSEQLRITTLEEIGRVGCNNDLGEIVANTTGGWDNSPYVYRLEYFDGSNYVPSTSAAYATFASNGSNNRFTGLSSGNYRVTVRDIEACEHSETVILNPVDPIEAEARIDRQLECPSGNDAVIVAVEPGTTNPGAIGGVSGGGYQYRLLRIDPTNLDPANPGALDLTDPANIISTTGQQNEPEFEGSAGTGVISGGWYAIEIVSTLNCQSFTVPIQVVPPPAIEPALIQTSVPACGNIATMLIRVNNPQGGTYEYRRIYPDTHPMYVPPGDPSIVWLPVDEIDANGLPVKRDIPGTVNESYRYEVRRNGTSTSCLARKTRGITITEAEPLVLEPTSPTFDVSCAYEVDGRIEAIATGGTGIYEFRVYDSDPGADAFAALPLTTYENRAMQDFGTFENLDAGDYWISVISRQNCGVVQGPFTIAPAAPVIITQSATPTTCFGESDGTITMNVTSATPGLVKFSIEPNLSEFFSDPDNPMTYTFTDLAPRPFGDGPGYIVLAQDAEGCPQTFEIYVETPEELSVTDVTTNPETCIAAADGSAQLFIEGGTPFVDNTDPMNPVEYYQTRLIGPTSDGTEVFLRNDNLIFQNLAGGVSYIVFVQDANMCGTFVEVPIEIGVDLTAEPIVQYGCEVIFPNSTARVELEDNTRISEILFALDPINPSDAVTAIATTERAWGDLPAGEHIVYIYHENGCTNTVEFTIEAYEPLTLEAQKTGPNELTAIAGGGFGGYEYFFNGESYGDENVYTTTESGMVEVRVVDQNGCVAVASIPFEFTGMLELPQFFTPNGDNENDFWSPKNREFFPNIEVIIYDRYGRVVAELDQVSKWDGLYDGKELPSGDYWYVVNQNDKRSTRYVGHFTLYR